MAQITAALVKELREKSGAGMMDCKKALAETDGDKDAAVDWLRQKGLSKAAKKSSRVAAEGLVAVQSDGTTGAVVEVNSETDFVARNEQFQELVGAIAKTALTVDGIDALTAATIAGGEKSVADTVTDAVATIGENMTVRRTNKVSVGSGVVASYVHGAVVPGAGKIGVLVALESTGDAEKLAALGKQIAMHIAAAKPESLSREDLDPAIVERERTVQIEMAKESGKPQEIAEKMVEGRIRKFYEEVCLLEQTFVIDNETKIRDVVANAGKELGTDVTLSGFVSYILGDGIEKEETDFAAEVAAAAGV